MRLHTRALLALPVVLLSAGALAEVKTGTYTGNGTSRVVTGVGFNSGCVIPMERATAAVGAPSVDVQNSMVYVGSDQGVICGVRLPLP